MPRVKRSVHARKKRAQGARAGEGLLGPQEHELHATRRSRSSTRSSTPTATARTGSATFRRLWIIRINAGARAHGLSYNQFISGLKAAETSSSTARCSPTSR